MTYPQLFAVRCLVILGWVGVVASLPALVEWIA